MSQFKFDRVLQNMEQLKRELPPVLANQAQNYFVQAFTAQGLGGKKWKEVQRRIPGTKAYKYPKNKGLSRRTKPILVETGKLRRAVSNSIRQAQFDKIRLVVDLPYADRQNQDRPFMADTNELRSKQRTTIINYIDKVWH